MGGTCLGAGESEGRLRGLPEGPWDAHTGGRAGQAQMQAQAPEFRLQVRVCEDLSLAIRRERGTRSL